MRDRDVAEAMRRMYLSCPPVLGGGRGPGSVCAFVHTITYLRVTRAWKIFRRLIAFGAIKAVDRGQYRKMEWYPYAEDVEVISISPRRRRV
jgi:hypothetical protein